jgi:hypothetical protein
MASSSRSLPDRVALRATPRAIVLLEPAENNGLGLIQEAYAGFTLTLDGAEIQLDWDQAAWVVKMLAGALKAEDRRAA